MIASRVLWALSAAALALASPAHATPDLNVMIGDAGQQDQDGSVLVDLRLLNEGKAPQVVPLPDHVEARIERAGQARTMWLERTSTVPEELTIPPGRFARARYRFGPAAGEALDGALFSIPAWNARATALVLRPAAPAQQIVDTGPALRQPQSDDVLLAAAPPSNRFPGNAFLGNLSAYQPIYAVYGPGTDSEARIQVSFKYQLFGSRRAEGLPRSFLDGLHFAFTQRMFWDLGANSSPFRNIDYQPELFYLTPSATFSNGISLSAQAGIRHESNGRDGTASRSINSIYAAPMAAFPLGGGYRLSLAPRISFYVGDTSDNPDIRRYRGNSGLFMEVGTDGGLRISTLTRFNFRSGKGAANADISYPLKRILGGGPDFYLFGQGFFGYGENLLDYNRRMTRVRVGIALVR